MHLKHRRTCRACGSTALVPAITLQEQHIQTDFAKPDQEQPVQRIVPLKLVRCDPTQDENACGLLQSAVSVPPAILYSRYWYRSGVNTTMTRHLQGIALEAQHLFEKPGRVLDIGCNDGTLLAAFPSSWKRVGIDPSDVISAVPLGVDAIRTTFPSTQVRGKFDLITAIACFYDLEDPVAFARSVRDHLLPHGAFIFEQSYMPRMLERLSYDTICHEHLEYYSLAVIERICRDAGLRVFSATFNDINGGSIRCYASRDDSSAWPEDAGLLSIRRREFDLRLDAPWPYAEFERRMWDHKARLSGLLMRLKAEGKRIHVYGASTKGNTLLQFCHIDSTVIDVAADRSPQKWGARTVGTNIPIVSEEESRAMRPDYYLVLPWHFRDEFIERERATLAAGTQFIFPLPDISIVGADALAAAA